MKDSRLTPVAVLGALALCCLGPVLASLFVAFEVSVWFAQAGFVWGPILVASAAATGHFMRRRTFEADCCTNASAGLRSQECIQQ